MSRIFITGSADGLGELTAKSLIAKGHEVVLHARNKQRAEEALAKVSGAKGICIADLISITETIDLARQLNDMGKFDVIIHNAGVFHVSSEEIFAVNVVAPYILTCLTDKPERMIYLSSSMHRDGFPKLEFLRNKMQDLNYSDSKLLVLMLSMATSRKWKDVYVNSVDPGWIPTKMGGPNATDNLIKGFETQVLLAVSHEEKFKATGKYFYHQEEQHYSPEVDDIVLQENLLSICGEITDVLFPTK